MLNDSMYYFPPTVNSLSYFCLRCQQKDSVRQKDKLICLAVTVSERLLPLYTVCLHSQILVQILLRYGILENILTHRCPRLSIREIGVDSELA